jgi:uncharacterized protein YbjT (DUF2867 family)
MSVGERPLILVVGGGGVIGSEVIDELAGRAPVRALVRSRAAATTVSRADPAAELVPGDLADPSTLATPFAGVDRVFVLTPSVADQRQLEENALHAALAAGVERIVYLSNTEVDWGIELSRAHREVETMLVGSGVEHTIVRPEYLLDNLLLDAQGLAAGQLVAPAGRAECAFVDARDVGAVAAAALLADEAISETVVVTGPRAMSWGELAEQLSRCLGWRVDHHDPGPAEWAADAVGDGMDPWLATALREYFERMRNESPTVSEDILRVTGIPARSVEDFVRDKLAIATRPNRSSLPLRSTTAATIAATERREDV